MSSELLVRNSFKLLLFKPNRRNKLGFGFSKRSNERELNCSNYYCYLFIWLKSPVISAKKRNGRYSLDQKDCWHWGKMFSFQKLQNKCSKVFVIKFRINRHVSQVNKVLFTQKFSNKTIYFTVLFSNQLHNNFHFHEVFSQNIFKNFIKKIKILNVWLLKCPAYNVTSNQYIY